MLNIDPEGLGIRPERRCLGTGSADVLEQAARYGGEEHIPRLWVGYMGFGR